MSTIAEKLVQLNDSKQAIKGAIEAKGVTVGDAPLADYAGKISQIEGGGESSRFGLTLGYLGTLGADGTLSASTEDFVFDLSGVKIIDADVLLYMFYNNTYIKGFIGKDIVRIKNRGCAYSLFGSGVSGEINMSKLAYVGDSGCSNMFYNTGITKLLLPSLSEIDNGGCNGMAESCRKLVEVDLSGLMKIGPNGCAGMLRSTAITTISFPALYSVTTTSFGSASWNYIFGYCTALTEIHFNKAAQPQIEAMTGYADKWGAENATIYFDL